MKKALTFLGPPKAIPYEKCSVAILPCPLEKTTTYGKGTAKGPQAILQASHQVEFYDAELKEEVWPIGIYTLPPLPFDGLDAKGALALIEKLVGKILDDKKLPICLGGEHTLSAGAIAACAKRHPGLSVLQIDAHADLRGQYENNPYSHACAMRLIVPHVQKLVGVGIRSVDAEEVRFAQQNPKVTLIFDQERSATPWIAKAIEALTDTVYLTIDVDGFDPAFLPATGTPEPGGLSWYEGLDLLRACFQNRRVVGADLVELLPRPGLPSSDFTCAKLVYKLIGYYHRFQT